jgi:hypothetical protein
MKTATEYLHAAKIEEVACQLEAEGYEVVVHPAGRDSDYDLVARRNGEEVALAVEVRDHLAESLEHIRTLRNQARDQRRDFRLVVVSPPHKVRVDIEGIRTELRRHMVDEVPEELDELSSRTRLESVADLEFDSIRITVKGIELNRAMREVQVGTRTSKL